MGKASPYLIPAPSALDLLLGFFVWSSGQVHRGAEMQTLCWCMSVGICPSLLVFSVAVKSPVHL